MWCGGGCASEQACTYVRLSVWSGATLCVGCVAMLLIDG